MQVSPGEKVVAVVPVVIFLRTAHSTGTEKYSASGTSENTDSPPGMAFVSPIKSEFELLTFEEYCEAAAAVIQEFGQDVCVERFSGESPDEMLIAPDWCGDRERIVAEVTKILKSSK